MSGRQGRLSQASVFGGGGQGVGVLLWVGGQALKRCSDQNQGKEQQQENA